MSPLAAPPAAPPATPPEDPGVPAPPGLVLWLTGLPGAGKSTLAEALAEALRRRGVPVFVLDGDRLRRGLNADLGFSEADRAENVRRVGEVAALFAAAGVVCLVALVSPYAEHRERARAAAGAAPFLEVHVRAPLAVCEARDPKGMYRRARAGTLPGFTGIDDPYQAPAAPELVIDTDRSSVDEGVAVLLAAVLRARGGGGP